MAERPFLAADSRLDFVQTTIAMHENVARQLRDFLEEPIALEWGGLGDGLPVLTMDPMRYQLKDEGGGES